MALHQDKSAIPVINEDTSQLGTEALFSFLGKMGGGFSYFLFQIILARILGPRYFGLYAIGWTIFRIASLFTPLGLHNGVIRYGVLYWKQDEDKLKGLIIQSLSWALGSGLVIGLLFYLTSTWLSQKIFHSPELAPVLRWFAFGLPILTILIVAASATRLCRKIKYQVLSQDLAQPVAGLALVVTLVWGLNWHLLGSVIVTVTSFAVGAILAMILLVRIVPGILSVRFAFPQSTRELLLYSIPTALAGMLATSNVWVDRILIGHFRSPAEVGIYQAVSQCSVVFAIILSSFSAIFAPMVADLYNKAEMARFQEVFTVSTKWGIYLSIPLLLVIAFASPQIISVLFGPGYLPGVGPLMILAAGQTVNVATGSVGFLLVMTGRQNSWLLISGMALIMNIVLNCILIPFLGIVGAAVSTSLTTAGLFIAGLLRVRCVLGLWPYDRRYAKILLSAILAGIAVFLVRQTAFSLELVGLLLVSVVSLSVFWLSLTLLGFDQEDIRLFHQFKARFGHRLIT